MRRDNILRKLAARFRMLSCAARLQVIHFLLQLQHPATCDALANQFEMPRWRMQIILNQLLAQELILEGNADVTGRSYLPNLAVLQDLNEFIRPCGTASVQLPVYPEPKCC